ncbi:McrB family protein [Agrobacterium tumefaciens]|uniref:McrB family protein n=1 Tax=Agrobacterium tumefaciens TaxID=358 RepID=UPI0015760C17|nr:AAA family ATPase [Agrobacterium tumefaciens]NTZ89286.1 AAA family ATPase [Agrobacterium tumefaciens]
MAGMITDSSPLSKARNENERGSSVPIDNWGTPLRDVLADADVRLEVGEINSKLVGFLESSGQPYQRPYSEIAPLFKEQIAETRIETWKKLFQELGLLWIQDGKVQRTRFGAVVSDSYAAAHAAVERERLKIAAAAVRVLGRQQLLNPTTKNRDYPPDCDVLPYRTIWRAIDKLEWLHWEEVHRVLLRTMRDADVSDAINLIAMARQEPDYDPQNPRSAEKHLGPAVYTDPQQATRRITPWFSAAGFGGLLIDRESSGGKRKFTALGSLLIPGELEQFVQWQDFGDSQKAWFDYLDEAIEINMPQDMAQPVQFMPSELKDDDPIYLEVQKLLTIDRAAGVMFVGPPGTGKSWYARQIALKLTNGETSRIREVQFHPSYQYEDFVEGYAPDGQGGFGLVDKHLLKMISLASSTDAPVVMVIDEFSRTDPARTLGETLTYMESSLRGVPFFLPSGRQTSIPRNLVFFATMNPEDRSVDELDAAMERRWAKVNMLPDKERLRGFLNDNGADAGLIGPTIEFFVGIQRFVEVGHAFFQSVRDKASLTRLWETQLKYLVQKNLRFNPDALNDSESLWENCLDRLSQAEVPLQEQNDIPEEAAQS